MLCNMCTVHCFYKFMLLFYRTAVRYIGTLSVHLPNLCCGYVLIKTLVMLINVTKAFGMKDFVGM